MGELEVSIVYVKASELTYLLHGLWMGHMLQNGSIFMELFSVPHNLGFCFVSQYDFEA